MDLSTVVFIAFILMSFVGLAYGHLTVTGSGISERPYRKQRSDDVQDMASWTRGTR